MKRLLDLGLLFRVVAVLESSYFAAAMMPPSWVGPATGWVLSVDGHWIIKLMGVALLTQAYIAWIFRKQPHIALAKGLAFYQMGSATVDWVMWLLMADAGIFSNTLAQSTVLVAISSHYLLGVLLIAAIVRVRGANAQEAA
jgi:hypothetical protein